MNSIIGKNPETVDSVSPKKKKQAFLIPFLSIIVIIILPPL